MNLSNNTLKPLRVGLVGCGVVGAGVVATLLENKAEITRRLGRDIIIEKIAVRDPAKKRDINMPIERISADWRSVVNDANIDVVVELIGGSTVASDVMMAAINQGKHVVTANKALIAINGNTIFAQAAKHKVIVAFEAAVAGGIPIIKAIREGLSANYLDEVVGIINGTSNYILSEMFEHGGEFADILAEAQRLGYAEADPTFDIDGIDAKHKIAILGAMAFGHQVPLDSVFAEGIRNLNKIDIDYAEEFGYRVKLLAIARRSKKGIELRVHPTLIPAKSLLANVEGVMNAVLVKGDRVGSTVLYGAGAGANPTASAVVADLVDIARLDSTDIKHHVPYLAFQNNQLHDEAILDISQIESGFYVRIIASNQDLVLAEITGRLATQNISIDSILQYPDKNNKAKINIMLLIQKVKEGVLKKALTDIESLSVVFEPIITIRREELD